MTSIRPYDQSNPSEKLRHPIIIKITEADQLTVIYKNIIFDLDFFDLANSRLACKKFYTLSKALFDAYLDIINHIWLNNYPSISRQHTFHEVYFLGLKPFLIKKETQNDSRLTPLGARPTAILSIENTQPVYQACQYSIQSDSIDTFERKALNEAVKVIQFYQKNQKGKEPSKNDHKVYKKYAPSFLEMAMSYITGS